MKSISVLLILFYCTSCGPNAEQKAQLEKAALIVQKAHDDSIIEATKAEIAKPSPEEKAQRERAKQDSIDNVQKGMNDSIEAANKAAMDKEKADSIAATHKRRK